MDINGDYGFSAAPFFPVAVPEFLGAQQPATSNLGALLQGAMDRNEEGPAE